MGSPRIENGPVVYTGLGESIGAWVIPPITPSPQSKIREKEVVDTLCPKDLLVKVKVGLWPLAAGWGSAILGPERRG